MGSGSANVVTGGDHAGCAGVLVGRAAARYREWVKHDDAPLPLKPPADSKPAKPPILAPPWVARLAAQLGLLTLISALALPFVPGSRDPLKEQETRQFAPADKFILVPVYGSILSIFVGGIVIRQMRAEPRPLPEPLVAQRVQAWAGIGLALAAVVFFYAYVGFTSAARRGGKARAAATSIQLPVPGAPDETFRVVDRRLPRAGVRRGLLLLDES